jgi:5-methylcytosine-specific restriction protein B
MELTLKDFFENENNVGTFFKFDKKNKSNPIVYYYAKILHSKNELNYYKNELEKIAEKIGINGELKGKILNLLNHDFYSKKTIDSNANMGCPSYLTIKRTGRILEIRGKYTQENSLNTEFITQKIIPEDGRTSFDDYQFYEPEFLPSQEKIVTIPQIEKMIFPKNIILYGPPGTGKTYNSIDKAVEISEPERYNPANHVKNKVVFDELRKSGQIEFVTFHQNYSYEDFVVGISPDVTSGTLRFDKREGIFKQLAERAKLNWLSSNNQKKFNVDFDFVFSTFFSKLIEEEVAEIEIPMKSRGYKFKVTSIDIEEGRIKFTKQSGGTGHDLLIKNLKAIYEGSLDYGFQGLGVYYTPLVEQLKEFAETIEQQNSEEEEMKNFVLIIDEINRANISKVFGELITLLEDDKRLGEENELKVTLPNGEKEFGVPPNLYIIGTMNTADKSIALVDIALRRRFEFIGYYPHNEQLNNEAATLLRKLNDAVYKEKKSADYLIGHAYFMKGQEIEIVLKNKVIPLLMEYFSGKTDIVSKIFIDTNWNVSYNTTNFLWDIELK